MAYLSTTNFLDDEAYLDRWQYTLRTG